MQIFCHLQSTIKIGKRSVNYEKDLRAPWNIYFIARSNIAHDCTNLDDNLFTFFSESTYHDFKCDIDEYVNNCLVKSQQPSAKHQTVIKAIKFIQDSQKLGWTLTSFGRGGRSGFRVGSRGGFRGGFRGVRGRPWRSLW